jgi:hypothetical protein
MKKNNLKYLMDLHARIGKGCEILKVSREGFMPALTQCLELVSLGMELGVRMKGKPDNKLGGVPSKAKTGAKPSAKSPKKAAQLTLLREKAIKRLSKGEVQFKILVKDLTKYAGDVAHPEQAIWSFLQRTPEIQQVTGKRGFYRLRPKNKKGAKKKTAANGKATTVAASPLVH